MKYFKYGSKIDGNAKVYKTFARRHAGSAKLLKLTRIVGRFLTFEDSNGMRGSANNDLVDAFVLEENKGAYFVIEYDTDANLTHISGPYDV